MSDTAATVQPAETDEDDAQAVELHVDHVDPADHFRPVDNDEARRVYVFMQLAGAASEFTKGEFVRALHDTAEFLRSGFVPPADGQPKSNTVLQLITKD